jgi:hypothetical protein
MVIILKAIQIDTCANKMEVRIFLIKANSQTAIIVSPYNHDSLDYSDFRINYCFDSVRNPDVAYNLKRIFHQAEKDQVMFLIPIILKIPQIVVRTDNQ